MKNENTNQAAYQILGKWHIHRGVILYIVTLPDALELILSSGIAMRISQQEALMVPCLLAQLAQLIADGADLPMISVSVRACPNMLPREAKPVQTSGSATGVSSSAELAHGTQPSEKKAAALPLPFPRASFARGSDHGAMGR